MPHPAPTPLPGELTVLPWADDLIDSVGYDPRSDYVERFWLGVIGPSSVWFLRRLAVAFDESPEGFVLDTVTCARSLGLGEATGRNGALPRTVSRLASFGTVQLLGGDTLVVRRRLPPLSERQLARLPVALQDEHARWWRARHPVGGAHRRTASWDGDAA